MKIKDYSIAILISICANIIFLIIANNIIDVLKSAIVLIFTGLIIIAEQIKNKTITVVNNNNFNNKSGFDLILEKENEN